MWMRNYWPSMVFCGCGGVKFEYSKHPIKSDENFVVIGMFVGKDNLY